MGRFEEIQKNAFRSEARPHELVHGGVTANGRALAGQSWEIYGDWTEDPAKLETEVVYLLR